MQHLGERPSAFWGHQTIPFQLQGFSPDTFRYVAHATRQPKHEFQRLMVSDHPLAKRGGSVISALGHAIQEIGGHIGTLIQAGANFAARHENTISNIGHLGQVVSGVGAMTGLISGETAQRIHSGASFLRKPGKPKTGGAWVDFK